MYWIACPICQTMFKRTDSTVPDHTRPVRGIGWGGKPMHLPCQGAIAYASKIN